MGQMGKYDKLFAYVKENNVQELSFEEIEKIIGFELDHSFLHAKNSSNYEVKISLKTKRVFFNERKYE